MPLYMIYDERLERVGLQEARSAYEAIRKAVQIHRLPPECEAGRIYTYRWAAYLCTGEAPHIHVQHHARALAEVTIPCRYLRTCTRGRKSRRLPIAQPEPAP